MVFKLAGESVIITGGRLGIRFTGINSDGGL